MIDPGDEAPSMVGRVLAGQYRIERALGSGGMAFVYEVTELASGRRVALKLLRASVASSAEAAERLRREGELLRRIRHPSVVSIEGHGQLSDGTIYVAMELLEGETLGAVMRRERMSPAELLPIVSAAAEGLEAAHRMGVIHRDMKPDNIFIARDAVKLLDFGIAKAFDYERLTQTGQVIGTPRYMAPEQLAADPELDARVDVYAMGVILYEALAGQPPFVATNPGELIVAIIHGKVAPLRLYRPELPPELEAVILRCMARSREARYGSIREAAEAFANVASALGGPGAVSAPGSARTNILGSFAIPELASPAPEPAPLRPGTFSGFLMPEPGLSPSEEADTLQGARRPVPAAPPPRPPLEPSAASIGASPAPSLQAPEPAHSPFSEAPPPPAGLGLLGFGRRPALIAAALLAGAVSAALVVLALQHFGARSPVSPIAPGLSGVASGSSAAPGSEPGAGEPGAGEPSAGEPSAAQPGAGEPGAAQPGGQGGIESAPPAPARIDAGSSSGSPIGVEAPSEPADPAAEARRRRRQARREARAAGAARGEAAPPPPFISGAPPPVPAIGPAPGQGLLEQARAARRSGDARRCVELAGDAQRAGGGAEALYLVGDCEMRAGDQHAARAALER
ncbi:MAG: protein kinase, partial [Myxococcales bacterium]|nr:protein kinase [Myxococcales bacterium]